VTRAVQIAIDCHDPHALNRFWAELMEYEIEDHSEQIEQVVAGGFASLDDTVLIDGKRAWKVAAACHEPRDGGNRLLFQQVPEAKSLKNRVHLDVRAGDRRQAVVERCIEMGAVWLWDGSQGPHTWVTMADPEGNEFCVS
jgi:hypothetical protein